MIEAKDFLKACQQRDFKFFTGTPCSYLKPFINAVINDENSRFLMAVNEGEAVAHACGAWLGGLDSVVMFQNSGLGNAVNPLTSLSHTFNIPFLGIVTLRGEPGGAPDEPQHELMGEITTQLLETMKIPWDYFPQDQKDIAPKLEKAQNSMRETRRPYFFVMKKSSVSPTELEKNHSNRPNQKTEKREGQNCSPLHTRTEILETALSSVPKNCAVIATTGKCGRELFELEDRDLNFYMVGSMGLAPAVALGLKIAQPELPVCVLDGDGAMLMRTGSLATIARAKPQKWVHLLLNNGTHDSTGGQSTDCAHVDFELIARGFGLSHSKTMAKGQELGPHINSQLNQGLAPLFIHVPILPGSPKNLGRPTVTPLDVATRFRHTVLKVSQERSTGA